jgi:GT2 family glycosyltransferase/glycosyltransferase involved in cell wall biosynthesis
MRILQVVHGLPPAANGGTEVYTRDLAAALAASWSDEVAVLTRHADPHARELSLRMRNDDHVSVFSINNTFQSCESFEESYSNPAIEQFAAQILDDWQPDVVHIQHLTCLSTGIPRQAVRRDIPVVVTLNDYWLICHRGQLVDRDGHRCSGPEPHGCAGCLPPGALAAATAFRSARLLRSTRIRAAATAVNVAAHAWDAVTSGGRTRGATLDRLRRMRRAVSDVDLFLAPSDTLAAQFSGFGIPNGRLARCNQGISLAPFDNLQRSAANQLRLGFVGGLLPTKGCDVLLDAVDLLPPGAVTLDLLGGHQGYHGEIDFAESMMFRLGHPAIRRLGVISHDRMATVLGDLDVLIVPSIWIENAPFIIREAFAARVPVVASDLGGMAEMIRHDVDGLLFRAGESNALAAALRRLLDEPGLLDKLRAGIVRPMSIEEDAARLRTLYEGLRSRDGRKHAAGRGSRSAVLSAPASDLSTVVLNYRTPDQTALAVNSLRTSRTTPASILIVDNHSADGSAAMLRDSFPGIRVMELPDNLGFSGGCNVGIRAALAEPSQFVMLMNSDAVLAPEAIDHLLAAMTKNPSLGIAAPVLLSREEPDHVSSAGISFSERTGRMRHRAPGRQFAALGRETVHVVDAVSGCVMLIRREVFEKIGLLDEAYFFSFEDIDFCLRARGAGFQTACVNDARAYHEGGRTIGRRSSRRVYFGTRNHLRLAARVGRRSSRPLRLGLVAGFNAAYVLMSPESPLLGGFAAFIRGMWDHANGRYGPG